MLAVLRTPRLLLGALLFLFSWSAWAQVPGVTWATGGGAPRTGYGRQAQARGVATDAAGNTYVTGIFRDTLTLGTSRLISTGDYDVYVAKLDAAGQYQWATQATGRAWDISNGIALDAAGNIYITGYSEGSTISFGPQTITNPGFGSALYVAKLSPTGTWLRATIASPTGYYFSYILSDALAVDAEGAVYVTGSLNGEVQFGATTLHHGLYGAFVAKLSSAGTWQWATVGDGPEAYGNAIALDRAGNAYVTGSFTTPKIVFGAFSLTNAGYGTSDIFVAKLTAAGAWQWVSRAGGQYNDGGRGIVVDAAGNAYVTGAAAGPTPRFGTISPTKPDDSADLFVGKLDPTGTWQWVTLGGGTGEDYGAGILLNEAGNLTVVGTMNSPTATFGALPVSTQGKSDVAVAQLDAAGHWLWALSTGGPGDDYGVALASAPQEEVRIAGTFDGPSATFGATTLPGGAKYYEYYADCQFVASVADLAQRSPAGLTLWPNPSQGAVYATGLETGQPVQVFDSMGRLVAADARPAYEAQGLALPTLAAGMYIMRCGSQTRKFVIQ